MVQCQVCYETVPGRFVGTRIQSVARRRALHGTLALPSYFRLLGVLVSATELKQITSFMGLPWAMDGVRQTTSSIRKRCSSNFLPTRAVYAELLKLSHETKIASTVEIFAGLATRRRLDDESVAEAKREAGHCRFNRLGHVNFSTNEQTGYGAREQKDIQVSCDARFLKLVIMLRTRIEQICIDKLVWYP